MGLYFFAYRPFGRRHLNDNEINFLFGANHPALGTDLLIFVYGGTLAISSEYELLSQYHYLQVTICFIKVTGTLIDFVYLKLMQNVGLLRMMSQQVIHQHDDKGIYGPLFFRVSSFWPTSFE